MELPEYEVNPRVISKSACCTIHKVTFASPLPSNLSTAILKTRCRENFAQCYSEKRIYERLRPFPDLYPCLYQVKAEEKKHIMTFIVEDCEDGDLQTWVESQKGVNRDQARSLLVEVSKALRQLHMLGIAHNQLVPSNVLLSKGHFKLGGFGAATELSYISNRRSGPVSNPPEFSKDVFNLAATFLTYFAADCGLSIAEASERERFGLVEQYLAGPEVGWRATLKDMLRTDANQRISAAQAYENFASQASYNPFPVAPSVASSESLNHSYMQGLLNRPASSTTVSLRSQPYLPAVNSEISTDRVLQDDISHSFMVAFEPIIVLMQHSILDEAVLSAKITAVMDLLKNHHGAVEVGLQFNILKCSNSVCDRRLPAYQLSTLKCEHVFCKDCFNQELNRELRSVSGMPNFRCPICNTPVDVFALSSFIYSGVMADIRLRQMTLNLVRCPFCPEVYDASTSFGPSTVHCSGCGGVFCSYCRKPKRHFFRCSKWARDKKNQGR